MFGVRPEGDICEISTAKSKMSKMHTTLGGRVARSFCVSGGGATPLKRCQKIIINHKHDLNKIQSIINTKNPELLVLESEKASLNIRTNSIAYKLMIDDGWIGIETKSIKRKRDLKGLLKITLINQ